MRRAWLLWVVAFVLLFAAVESVTLKEPYHYDTTAYMQTVRHFLSTGEIASFYATRPVAGYAFVPLAPVFGEGTLPVTTALAYAVSVTLASLLFLRLLGSPAAIAGVVAAAATPASLITATHGKEDFVALLFVMLASLVLLRGRRLHAALGGALFGLALLTKEVTVVVTPFVLGLAFLSAASNGTVGPRLLDAGLAGAASLAILFLLSPDYPARLLGLTGALSTGQFRGPFSDLLPVGIRAWRMGVGDALFFGAFAGLLAPVLEPSRRRRLLAMLLLGQAALLGLFLANITTLHYRHFLWPAFFALPVAAVGVARLLERILGRFAIHSAFAHALFYSGVAAVTVTSLWTVLPAVLLRHAYNPVASFYSEIRLDPKAAVLLGMDNCIHAVYFTELECRTHPVHPDARAVAAQVEDLLDAGRAVYLLPDFFAYDRFEQLRLALEERFALRALEGRWYEDYHAMDFGVRPADLLGYLGEQRRGCAVEFAQRAEEAELAAPLRIAEFRVRCPGEADRVLSFAMAWGRVLPGFHRDALQQVIPRDSDLLPEGQVPR